MLCCKSTSSSDSCFSICSSFRLRRGDFFVDKRTACFRFIVLLLAHRNRLRRITDLYAKRTAGGCNAEVLVAEATDEVEGFLRRLLLCEAKRIGLDLLFDGGADMRCRSKESIRGHQSLDALMWTLEVVVLHEELDAPKAVREISEHRLAEKLLPQRFPKPFDLAERLGVLRPALAVLDAVAP